MKSNAKRGAPSLFSTQECKQMMGKNFGQFVNEQFLNEDQEDLVERCSSSLHKDQLKEENIKNKLIREFFSKHKRKNTKQELRSKYQMAQTLDQTTRNNIANKIKDSLSIVLNNRSASKSRPKNHRYGDSSPLDFSFCRPFTSSLGSTPQSKTSQRKGQQYNLRIDTIIQESNRLKSRKIYARKGIQTASERNRQAKLEEKKEKNQILDKIIQNDIDDYLKSYPLDEVLNPEAMKLKYEQRKRKQLSLLDKYNMSFIHYVRQKTHSNIEKSVYNEKIRQKNSYIQKFQKYILEEFKFSEEFKRRLEKVFEGIEEEFKGPKRNKEMRERIKAR